MPEVDTSKAFQGFPLADIHAEAFALEYMTGPFRLR